MKRILAVLCLLSFPAFASDVFFESVAITTTAAYSSQLQYGADILVQCTQDAYIKQIGSGAGTAATSTNAIKVLAGVVYSTDTKGGLRYLSIKADTTSGTCQIFTVSK